MSFLKSILFHACKAGQKTFNFMVLSLIFLTHHSHSLSFHSLISFFQWFASTAILFFTIKLLKREANLSSLQLRIPHVILHSTQRTEEGKACVALNRQTHALFSMLHIKRADNQPQSFKQLEVNRGFDAITAYALCRVYTCTRVTAALRTWRRSVFILR